VESFFLSSSNITALNRRIPTPPPCQIDPLYHDIMDFQPLLEGDPAGPARYFGLMRQGEN